MGITVLGALTYGSRWWPAFLVLACAVALTLLLAPDAYEAFGLALAAAAAVSIGFAVRRGVLIQRVRAYPSWRSRLYAALISAICVNA